MHVSTVKKALVFLALVVIMIAWARTVQSQAPSQPVNPQQAQPVSSQEFSHLHREKS